MLETINSFGPGYASRSSWNFACVWKEILAQSSITMKDRKSVRGKGASESTKIVLWKSDLTPETLWKNKHKGNKLLQTSGFSSEAMRVYYFVLMMDLICVGNGKTVVLVQDYSPDVDGLPIWSGKAPGQWNGQLAESGYGMVRETESRVSQELEDIEGPREIHWANPRTGGGDVDVLVGVDVSQAPERPRSAQKRAGEKPGLVAFHRACSAAITTSCATPDNLTHRSTHVCSRPVNLSIAVASLQAVIMTSTIGIPIKLLNEATVRARRNDYLSRACSQKLLFARPTADQIFELGPRCHSRAHHWPGLPRQAT